MTISSSAAFRVQEKFFRGVVGKEEIPAHLHAPGSPAGKHLYGPGIGHAVAMLLTGQVNAAVDPHGNLDVQYPSSSGQGPSALYSENHQGVCHWDEELPDTTPGAPILDVVRGYAHLYPELINAEVEGPVMSDDQSEARYTVKTRAAYKG